MTHDELLLLFRRSGALLEGHFRLTSGLHSPRYLQCALVLSNPANAAALAEALAPQVGLARRHRGPVARAGRHRDRPRNGPRAGRARDLCRAPGRSIDATARLHVGSRRPGAGGRRRRHHRRLDTRDHGGGARSRAPRSSGRRRSSTEAAATRTSACPYHALLPMAVPTYDPAACPLCAAGRAGGQAGKPGLTNTCTSFALRLRMSTPCDPEADARLRRHPVCGLATAGRRHVHPGPARDDPHGDRRHAGGGGRRRADRRRRARAGAGRQLHAGQHARHRHATPRAERAAACRRPRARGRGGRRRVSRALLGHWQALSVRRGQRTARQSVCRPVCLAPDRAARPDYDAASGRASDWHPRLLGVSSPPAPTSPTPSAPSRLAEIADVTDEPPSPLPAGARPWRPPAGLRGRRRRLPAPHGPRR